MWAKQSTALTLIVGPVLDSSGVEYTSAVIGDLSISKNGGTLTALAAAATLTHIANGQYTLVLTTGNTDTLGVIQITCNKSTYQLPTVERMIVPANVYDSIISGSDALQVDTVEITGIDGSELTAIPWNAAWDAEVQSEVQDAIEANHLDHLLAATYDPSSKPGAADALLNELIGNDAGVSQFTANALELSPTGGSAPTAAAIADAVWDEAVSDHLSAGSTGESLNAAGSAGDPWTTTLPGAYTGSQAGKMLSDILTDTGTTLQAELDGIQADTEDIQSRLPAALVSGRMDVSVGAMAANVVTASALASDSVTEIAAGTITAANVTSLLDRLGYIMATIHGLISNARSATETFVITIDGTQYTAQYSGQDSSGNRSTTTLSKV